MEFCLFSGLTERPNFYETTNIELICVGEGKSVGSRGTPSLHVVYKSSTPQTFGQRTFEYVKVTLYVPDDAISDYVTATNVCQYKPNVYGHSQFIQDYPEEAHWLAD